MGRLVNDDFMTGLAAKLRKEGIRPFARRTGVPIATVHKWAHHRYLQAINADDLRALIGHFGGVLKCEHMAEGLTIPQMKRAGIRKGRTKTKPQPIAPTT